MGTKTLLIDESQRAVDRNGTIVKQEIAFWLQELYEENYISLVIVGLGRTNFLFEQDTQVERRWDSEIRMTPYEWGSLDSEPDSRSQFIGLLFAFRENFPMAWPTDLSLDDDVNCLRFYYASRGVIGMLKKLLYSLLRVAVSDKIKRLDVSHFYAAYDKAFRKDVNGERLDNPFDWRWTPVLPPRLADDTKLINPPRRRGKPTKKEQKASLTHALTVA